MARGIGPLIARYPGPSRIRELDVLIDVPMQRIDQPTGTRNCGVVLANGEVRTPGPVWEAITPAIDGWVRSVRVFLASPMMDPAIADAVQARISDIYH